MAYLPTLIADFYGFHVGTCTIHGSYGGLLMYRMTAHKLNVTHDEKMIPMEISQNDCFSMIH